MMGEPEAVQCGAGAGAGAEAEERGVAPAAVLDEVIDVLRNSGYIVEAAPVSAGPDEDGQLWLDDYDIRLDLSCAGAAPTLYVDGEEQSLDRARSRGLALLVACAAAAASGT